MKKGSRATLNDSASGGGVFLLAATLILASALPGTVQRVPGVPPDPLLPRLRRPPLRHLRPR